MAAIKKVTPEAANLKPEKAKPFKIPKKLGEVADLLYATRAARLAKEKEAEELKSQESQLKQHLIDNLPKSETTGVAGKTARVQVVVKQRVGVDNWDALYAHIKKTGAFDLLQRRVSDTAVKDRWENSKQVPGVSATPVVDVSITKV